MKFIHTVLSFSLILFALAGCFTAEAERDNSNDPGSGDYNIAAEVTPATQSTVSGHEDIVIKFTDRMDPSTVVLGGDIIVANTNSGTADAWTKTVYENDTLTIKLKDLNTKAFWPKGTGKIFTVNGKTAEGTVIPEISVTYDVVYRVYVHKDGDDETGYATRSDPVETIQKGITLAGIIYAGSASEVYVAEGDYNNSADLTKPVVDMKDRISIVGGFSKTDWGVQAVTCVTTIEDKNTSGGSSTSPNKAIYIGDTITGATTLSFVTVKMGSGSYSAAVFCKGNAVMDNINVKGKESFTEAGVRQYGIFLYNDSTVITPVIQNSIINAGWNNNQSGYKTTGILIYTNAAPVIKNNTLNDSYGDITYGIYVSSGSSIQPSTISENTIYSGLGKSANYCIYIMNSHPIINQNVFSPNVSSGITYCIYEEPLTFSNPTELTRNNFKCNFGNWYYDNRSSGISVDYTNWDTAGNEISVGVSTEETRFIINSIWNNDSIYK